MHASFERLDTTNPVREKTNACIIEELPPRTVNRNIASRNYKTYNRLSISIRIQATMLKGRVLAAVLFAAVASLSYGLLQVSATDAASTESGHQPIFNHII